MANCVVACPKLVRRYQVLLASPDPAQRRLAEAQLARLRRAAAPHSISNGPSRWAHVPIAELFEQAGNILVERRNGTIVTGHEPIHGSKSGTCVVIWPDEGRWWCSNCRRGGDAVGATMSLEGCSYPAAQVRLRDRYGAPAGRALRQSGARARVRGLVVEVDLCD